MRFPRKGMILAAGLGTRLRPLTDTVPKALVEIGGRPMIDYPLLMLAAAGVEDVVVNLHHLGDAIREALGESRHGVRIHYSPEDRALDTGGALAHARSLLGDEPFALANCDALLDPNLDGAWRLHRERRALATLVVRADPQAEKYGALDCDASGRVRRFLGEPANVDGPLERRMFCGVHLVSPEIFTRFPEKRVFSITRDVYAGCVSRGETLYGFHYDGYWRDLGTAQELDAARADVTTKRYAPAYLRSY